MLTSNAVLRSHEAHCKSVGEQSFSKKKYVDNTGLEKCFIPFLIYGWSSDKRLFNQRC